MDRSLCFSDLFFYCTSQTTGNVISAPILRPKNHPVMSGKVKGMPEEMLDVIKELRSTPAGKYALNLYKEKRH